jgi:hypothetical protein
MPCHVLVPALAKLWDACVIEWSHMHRELKYWENILGATREHFIVPPFVPRRPHRLHTQFSGFMGYGYPLKGRSSLDLLKIFLTTTPLKIRPFFLSFTTYYYDGLGIRCDSYIVPAYLGWEGESLKPN